MIDLQKALPGYLNEKHNIVRLIVFTSVFALVFINIYSPFGADKWFDLTKLEFFTFSSLVILAGVMVVVISRILMYYYVKCKTFRIWEYLLWIICEVLMMSLVYALFSKFVLKDPRLFTDLAEASARNTLLVLLLPYTFMWLYLAWIDKKEQVEKMADIQGFQGNLKDMVAFYDDKSTLRFSVKKENLLYLESAENYVTIFYMNNGKVSRYLLRETLKKLEESFSGTEIIRCHRSYMVNFEKVMIIRKGREGLRLELDDPGATGIPVSKTYVENVMQTFSRYSRSTDQG